MTFGLWIGIAVLLVFNFWLIWASYWGVDPDE